MVAIGEEAGHRRDGDNASGRLAAGHGAALAAHDRAVGQMRTGDLIRLPADGATA